MSPEKQLQALIFKRWLDILGTSLKRGFLGDCWCGGQGLVIGCPICGRKYG